jgi:hypothetical protein
MASATHGDKPEWFRAPPGVVAVDIDTASGRLATDDCRRAPNAVVRTEYFAQGTQPIDLCPLHRSNFLRALVVPSATQPIATRIVAAAEPEAIPAVQAVSQTPSPAVQEPPAKKKRGFWSRVFGVGKNEGRSDRKD